MYTLGFSSFHAGISSHSSPPSPPSASSIQQLIPGQWYTARVQPMDYWRVRLPVSKPAADYQMNVTFLSAGDPFSSSLAVYGRKGGVPSVTRFDWAHIVAGDGEERRYVSSKRSAGGGGGGAAVVTLERSLSRGDWFIAVFNDDESGEARYRVYSRTIG